MTHMHIPDGILPVWLWVSGFVLMAVFLGVSLFQLRGADRKKKIPLLGALAASMLVVMNLEIVPLAYHLNLSVVAGILLGPSLGFTAAFIVNFMLALVGHGGVTVLGLNTLLLGSEAVLGHLFFYFFRGVRAVFWRGALATVFSLFLVSLLLIGIVGVSHVDIDLFRHEHGHEAGEMHSAGRDHDRHEEGASLTRFAVLILSLGLIGWILEAAITGAVLRFLARVKPDLLAHALHADVPRTRAGGGQ